jgi:hypothetical protein
MNSAKRAKRAYFKSRSLIVQLLDDGLQHTAKDLLGKGIRRGAAYQGLTRTWKAGLILRTTGRSRNLKSYSEGGWESSFSLRRESGFFSGSKDRFQLFKTFTEFFFV